MVFLQDILIEADIVGPSSIKGVMSGKHYNRSIYVHKVMFEALQRLRFNVFFNQLEDNQKDSIRSYAESLHACFEKSSETIINSYIFQRICHLYEDFVRERRTISPTFDYWSSYIDMAGMFYYMIRIQEYKPLILN